MSILARMATALQTVFGSVVEKAARQSNVIQRQRKFTAVTLAKTFILGFLKKPKATDEDLARMAVQMGVDVSPQAIEQRHTPQLVHFFQDIFRDVAKMVVGSDKALAPLLNRFSQVSLLDSCTITLPESLQEQFPGCGGGHGHGGGHAAIKLQTELDLRSGTLQIDLDAGRSSDNTSARQYRLRPENSLRIADLGYFNIPVLAEMNAHQNFFLSRLQFGTTVLQPGPSPVAIPNLLSWLELQPGPFVDVSIVLGQAEQLPCRLIAWRVPPQQADRRRAKLRQEMMQRKGKLPSAERLAWCDWSILITNLPPEKLSPKEAVVLYRARWQIELLFKRFKSLGGVALLHGSSPERQMVRVWARLVAAVLLHWLLVTCAWGEVRLSWYKITQAIQGYISQLLDALEQLSALVQVLKKLSQIIAKTCRRNKRRKKPGTLEMLENPNLLDFS